MRFGAEDRALWKSVISSIYGRVGRRWWPVQGAVRRVSPIWQGILDIAKSHPRLVEFYLDNIKITVRNGKRVKFWTYIWCNNSKLNEEFPRLFCLSENRNGSVMQFIQRKGSLGDWNLRFRRPLRV